MFAEVVAENDSILEPAFAIQRKIRESVIGERATTFY
jgi:hypothetical protein